MESKALYELNDLLLTWALNNGLDPSDEEVDNAVHAAVAALSDTGQDRESYTDDQDRESYTVPDRPCPARQGGKICCYREGHDETAFPHRFVYERAF